MSFSTEPCLQIVLYSVATDMDGYSAGVPSELTVDTGARFCQCSHGEERKGLL